jgi:hypothetical protein
LRQSWRRWQELSTPFWEFLKQLIEELLKEDRYMTFYSLLGVSVRVLFKIFLSLSLKAFMKVIGTFVIS